MYRRMESTIKGVANDLPLRKDNIEAFLDRSFVKIAEEYDLSKKNSQARAPVFGKAFELCFATLIETLYSDVILTKDPDLAYTCLKGASAPNFAVIKDGEINAIIEVTGSPSVCIVGDKNLAGERPALRRTDSIKKVIANAYLAKKFYPDALVFVVANYLPSNGGGKCMCDSVKGTLIKKFVDIKQGSDLDEMIQIIREKS